MLRVVERVVRRWGGGIVLVLLVLRDVVWPGRGRLRVDPQ